MPGDFVAFKSYSPISGGEMRTYCDVIKRSGFFDVDLRTRCAENGYQAYRALGALIHHIRAFKRLIKGWFSGDQEEAVSGRTYVSGPPPGNIAELGKGEMR